jgi:hypothetical protein
MTNPHSETGQMAVCCQNLTLGALSNRSALSLLVGALFKKFSLCLNTVIYSNSTAGFVLSDLSCGWYDYWEKAAVLYGQQSG